MDNLKSPYWEVYFWIFIIAIAIAGTAIIFIDSEGLASKFGNAGSFLGGLFTIAAVFIAVIAYKSSKKETHNRLGLESHAELSFELLPNLMESLEKSAYNVRGEIGSAKKMDWDLDISSIARITQNKENIENLKKLLLIKVSYLKAFTKIGDKKDKPFLDLLDFINEFIQILNYLLSPSIHFEGQIISIRKQRVESYMFKTDFYIKYLKRSVEIMDGNTNLEDAEDLKCKLKELKQQFESYIRL